MRVINLVGCVFENTSLKSNLDSNLRLFVISVTIIHVVVGRYIVVNNMSQGEARLPLDKKGSRGSNPTPAIVQLPAKMSMQNN